MDPVKPRMSTPMSRRRFLAVSGAAMAVAASAAPALAGRRPLAGSARRTSDQAVDLPDLSGRTGVLWGLKYDPHVEAYQRMSDAFREKTGATLSVEPIEPDLAPKFLAAMAAGTQPDIMCYYGPAMMPLHIQNALMPLKASVYDAQRARLRRPCSSVTPWVPTSGTATTTASRSRATASAAWSTSPSTRSRLSASRRPIRRPTARPSSTATTRCSSWRRPSRPRKATPSLAGG